MRQGILARLPGYCFQYRGVLSSIFQIIVVNTLQYCCQYPKVLLSIPQSIVVNTPKYCCQYSKVLLSIPQSIVVNTPKYCCRCPACMVGDTPKPRYAIVCLYDVLFPLPSLRAARSGVRRRTSPWTAGTGEPLWAGRLGAQPTCSPAGPGRASRTGPGMLGGLGGPSPAWRGPITTANCWMLPRMER